MVSGQVTSRVENWFSPAALFAGSSVNDHSVRLVAIAGSPPLQPATAVHSVRTSRR